MFINVFVIISQGSTLYYRTTIMIERPSFELKLLVTFILSQNHSEGEKMFKLNF